MASSPLRAKGRSLGDFQPLKPAEQRLLDAVRTGDDAILNNELPAKSTPENSLRAGFIRFLALGGDDATPIHENGINLVGAWIDGELVLDGTTVAVQLALQRCVIDLLSAFDAEIRLLSLDGSRLRRGLTAERMKCVAGIYLRDGFVSEAPIRLSYARCGADLDCTSSSFINPLASALDAPHALRIVDDFVEALARDDGSTAVDGEAWRLLSIARTWPPPEPLPSWPASDRPALDLRGVVVGGNVLFFKTSAYGAVDLSDARMVSLTGEQASFINQDSPLPALNLSSSVIQNRLDLIDANRLHGTLDLSQAAIGTLAIGSHMAWRSAKTSLVLDGAVYQRLGEGSFYGQVDEYGHDLPQITRAEWLLAWLRLQSRYHLVFEFRPQPWEQMITVLRASGHPGDARKIAIAKQTQVRRAGKIGGGILGWMSHWIYGWAAGYGYQPVRLLALLFGVWVACGIAYDQVAYPVAHDTALHLFVPAKAEPGAPPKPKVREFPPYSYSLDLIVPAIGLGYAKDWKPATDTLLGQLIRALIVLEQIIGWIGGPALALNVGGRLLKKD